MDWILLESSIRVHCASVRSNESKKIGNFFYWCRLKFISIEAPFILDSCSIQNTLAGISLHRCYNRLFNARGHRWKSTILNRRLKVPRFMPNILHWCENIFYLNGIGSVRRRPLAATLFLSNRNDHENVHSKYSLVLSGLKMNISMRPKPSK